MRALKPLGNLRGYGSPGSELLSVFDINSKPPEIVQLLKARGTSTVLELGSGVGWHVVDLVRSAFSIFGLDSSPEGISVTRQWLADQGLEADLRLQSMTENLPYEDAFFHAVVSVQVIHHADIAGIGKVVQEVSRVLKRGRAIWLILIKTASMFEAWLSVWLQCFSVTIAQSG